jgi:hypothetical protein
MESTPKAGKRELRWNISEGARRRNVLKLMILMAEVACYHW